VFNSETVLLTRLPPIVTERNARAPRCKEHTAEQFGSTILSENRYALFGITLGKLTLIVTPAVVCERKC